MKCQNLFSEKNNISTYHLLKFYFVLSVNLGEHDLVGGTQK